MAARSARIRFSSPTKAYPFGKAPERLGRCTHFGTVRPGGNSILAAKTRQRRKGLSARQASSASAHAGVHCGTIGAERLVLLVQGAKMVQSELPSGTSLCRLPPGPARSLRAVPGEPRPHDPPGRRECWACSGGDSLATGRRPGSGDVRFDTGVRGMVEPGRLGLCDACPLGVQLPRHGSAARRVDHAHGRAAEPARLEPGHRDSTTASGPVIATRRLNDPVNGVIHTRQNSPPQAQS